MPGTGHPEGKSPGPPDRAEQRDKQTDEGCSVADDVMETAPRGLITARISQRTALGGSDT